MYTPRPTLFPNQPCRTSHCLRTWQVVGEWPVVARGMLSSTAKNAKPTSTSGSDSGPQLTSLLPINRVRKLQKRNTSMSGRGTGTHAAQMLHEFVIITSELVKSRKPASTSASACPCIYLCVRPCVGLCVLAFIGLCVSLCAVGLRTVCITAVSKSEVKTPSGARMIG
jgi:hypothetical protein